MVALMVYVSTRIKKSAAAAYGREIIQTDTYSFTKPAGLICPIDRILKDSCLVHSKNFGETESTESLYQLEGLLTAQNKSFESLKAEAESEGSFAKEECGSGAVVLRGLATESGVEFKMFRRLQTSSNGLVFDFSVKVLCEALEEFQSKADEMVSSFTVK